MAQLARISDVPGAAALYHSVWHETQAPFMPIEERSRRNLEFFVGRMTKLVSTTVIEERSEGIVGFAAWHEHLLGLSLAQPPLHARFIRSRSANWSSLLT
jgi:hypothetical protein